jgi:GT2 family glycosyltransferase
MRIAVVIPVYNRRNITLRCLDSLTSSHDKKLRIIVIDSGSTDGTQQAIRENYSDVILLETSPSSWWAAATNLGVKDAIQAGCKYVVTCNDDNIASSATITGLMDIADGHLDSIVSSVICSCDNPDNVLFAGRRRAHLTDRFYFMDLGRQYSKLGSGIREVDLLHGKCTLFPVSVFNTVGLFDEKKFPHLFADDDLILRAKAAGYRLLVDLDAVVLNEEKKTGVNPYDRKLDLAEIRELFSSMKSAFQVSTRTRFLWRHRKNMITFIITWLTDYSRLLTVILLRWLLTDKMYRKLEKYYLQLISA